MLERATIFRRDTDQHDSSAGAREIDDLFDGIAAPGGFDGHVHFRTNGQGPRPELDGERHAPWKRISDEDFAGPGQFGGLDKKQSNGPCAENGHAVAQSYFRKIDGVERDAEWLEHRGGLVIDGVRHRETGGGWYDHELTQTAVIGIQTAEVEASAEIGMSALTQVAMVAWMSGINRRARAGTQLSYVRADLFDDTGKLVSEDERGFQDSVANTSIGECVKVAAADAGGRNAQENIAGAGFAGVGDALHPDVARTVEPRSQDGPGS